MEKLPSLSLVIPCHNEQEVLPDSYHILKKWLHQWMNDLISSYEIVLVNNGSTDKTLEVMLALKKMDSNITILDLRKNYGYQGSITAGLYNAQFDMIVSIDADLQDDPSKISEMISYYNQGFEMVLGIRQNRQSDSFLKRWTAKSYYTFLGYCGVKNEYNHGEFRLLSRPLVQDLKELPETNRYLRGLIFELESKYAKVYYDRRPREKGKTKFKPMRLLSLAFEGITSFSINPIRGIILLGGTMFFLSIIGLVYIAYIRLFTLEQVSGWAFIASLVTLFGGINSLSIGIVGEYVAKTYMETKRRALYKIRKKY